ncbi:phage major capsid protein [Streptomyces sp. NBC_01221]|uniref:phage major capsid protein n=1 Tax=Streptomyces sp. NBC_01221 TaxID=2903782 RepID=UPI002254FADA|nr:phage major capsid protein [Streptomyces sp. NBC_01221]MCX4786469.1 phage major capsid protein [Streptomyces sp. NBC_01221]
MLAFLRTQLQDLLEQRAALKTELDGVLAEPTTEKRNLTDDEQSAFNEKRDAIKAKDAEIKASEERIAELEESESRDNKAAELRAKYGQAPTPVAAGVTVTSEPETYRRGGGQSYFRDLFRAQQRGDHDAIDRLRRSDREVKDGLEQRALTTTDGGVGEFVPPLWMVDEYVKLARAGRVVADQIAHQPLPGGTDTISLPKLATGTSTAEQATQNTAVSNTDATSSSVSAAVATVAGQQVVSQQLLEQSPINMDAILLGDLAADYAVRLDTFVISNNAANKRGLLSASGTNAITYTDTTPTVGEAYSKVGDGIQQIHTGRFLPPDKIFMHPRRWAWYTVSVDTAGRPLVVPVAQMPQNVLATMTDVVSEGFVGTLQGLPVYVDPNIPTNLGAGTNEDRIIILRSSDVILFEGTPKAETFRETYAQNLSVLLRFYNYAALHSERYPKSISVVSGTGLVAPTF